MYTIICVHTHAHVRAYVATFVTSLISFPHTEHTKATHRLHINQLIFCCVTGYTTFEIILSEFLTMNFRGIFIQTKIFPL
jgi:hypothetical protein